MAYNAGDKLTLPIRSCFRYGFFVDLENGVDGFVHVTQVNRNPAYQTTDHLQEGQEVTVWVMDGDPETGRIPLTMIDATPRTRLEDLRVRERVSGVVVSVREQLGVFVDIGAERDGLLRFTAMIKYRTVKPAEGPQVGQQVDVYIQAVDLQKREIELSMLPPPMRDVEQLAPGTMLIVEVIGVERLPAGNRWAVDLDAGGFDNDGWYYLPGLIFRPLRELTEGERERVKIKSLSRDPHTNRVAQIFLDLVS